MKAYDDPSVSRIEDRWYHVSSGGLLIRLHEKACAGCDFKGLGCPTAKYCTDACYNKAQKELPRRTNKDRYLESVAVDPAILHRTVRFADRYRRAPGGELYYFEPCTRSSGWVRHRVDAKTCPRCSREYIKPRDNGRAETPYRM